MVNNKGYKASVEIDFKKKVVLVRRNTNCVADWIAKETMKRMSGFGWIRQPPSSLVYILDKDGLPAPH